ncbi:hypothetical protein [Dactylosporangium fulvum]|uniref:Pectate lyase domain-containing protein n=1 Tax=Dactylosporangium fulvum TaxID=53359 RepID=A0ABY5WAW1_9ACTN|nr:hypothetical protein [Dactylosporangium fulvum]UWP87202.1 hypothetical protein Dfulv_24350 [Dactylosporangium fulvum]
MTAGAPPGAGATGGAAADDAQVFVVRTRDRLAAAVAGDTPKIVLVAGKVDANEGRTCDDHTDPHYSLGAYLAAYGPAVRGRSARNQGDTIKINFGGNLLLTNVSNVIIRNVTFDAADCFRAWTPTNVWLDRDTFTDGANQDVGRPVHFGRPYQIHDGPADVIRGSDYVTVSYNNLFEHDKSMLIGSTDTPVSTWANCASPCTATASPTSAGSHRRGHVQLRVRGRRPVGPPRREQLRPTRRRHPAGRPGLQLGRARSPRPTTRTSRPTPAGCRPRVARPIGATS